MKILKNLWKNMHHVENKSKVSNVNIMGIAGMDFAEIIEIFVYQFAIILTGQWSWWWNEKWARKENNGCHQGKHKHKADLNVLIYNDFLFLKFFYFKKNLKILIN